LLGDSRISPFAGDAQLNAFFFEPIYLHGELADFAFKLLALLFGPLILRRVLALKNLT
jgi:hypothetical protein